MATREEALAAIDAASAAMASAVKATADARRMAIETGLLTADDLIAEGVAAVRTDVFGGLPTVTGYVGTSATPADVQAVNDAKQQVVDAARSAGQVLALLVRLAMAAAAAA